MALLNGLWSWTPIVPTFSTPRPVLWRLGRLKAAEEAALAVMKLSPSDTYHVATRTIHYSCPRGRTTMMSLLLIPLVAPNPSRSKRL